MTLFHWGTVAFAITLAASASALGSQDLDLCPGVQTAYWPSLLAQCYDEDSVKKCMEDSFDAQYSFCRLCQVVDEKNLDDTNNCLCIKCALSTLKSKCYKEFCPKEKNSHHILSQLIRDSNSYVGSIASFEFDSSLNFSEVNYFLDSEDSNKVYRNLLPQEKKNLINLVIKELRKDEDDVKVAGMDELEAFWRKKKKIPPSTKKETVILPLPEPEKPEPEPDENCGCDDDDSDYDGDSGHIKPDPPWIPDFDRTTTTTTTATDVILEYETIYRPVVEVTTNTDYETIWWPTTLTKVKHDLVTETEVYYEVFTKMKYKNNIVTKTETEIDELTKYIKVGEVTNTRTVEHSVKETKTLDPTISQTVINPTSPIIRTELTTVTHHNRHHRRKTWTRRMRRPHHSTAIVTVIRNHGPPFGLFNIPDDPAPLLASKRIVRLQNNNSNLTTTPISESNISNSNYGHRGRTKNTGTSSSISANVISRTDIRSSAAPQAATAMIVYTTLAVSLATSMLLAFSYGTDLNSTNDLSEEGMDRSPADDDDDDDDDDENNNRWLDAKDIELTDQVPKSKLSNCELVQKIR